MGLPPTDQALPIETTRPTPPRRTNHDQVGAQPVGARRDHVNARLESTIGAVIGDLDRDIQGDAECHRDDIQTRQQWMPSEVAQDVPAKEEEILRGQVSTADDAEKIVGRELVYLLVVAETSFRRGLRHRSNRHIAVGEVYKSRCAIGSLCRDPIDHHRHDNAERSSPAVRGEKRSR